MNKQYQDEVALDTITVEMKSTTNTPQPSPSSPSRPTATTSSFSPTASPSSLHAASPVPAIRSNDDAKSRCSYIASAKPAPSSVSAVTSTKSQHWSTTADGGLVARATCFLYKQLLRPPLKVITYDCFYYCYYQCFLLPLVLLLLLRLLPVCLGFFHVELSSLHAPTYY